MLMKIGCSIIGNLINMCTLSDPITGKIMRDANRTLGDPREGIF